MLSTPLRVLELAAHELNLAATVVSGQSFRWNRLAASPSRERQEWAIAVEDRTVVISQSAAGLHYRALYAFEPPHTAFIADLEKDTTRDWVRRYFQLDIQLAPLYKHWASIDQHFARKLAAHAHDGKLDGIRVLRQDPFETLCSFISSSNNHISRIAGMVRRVCEAKGKKLPHPDAEDDEVHEFETADAFRSSSLSLLPTTPLSQTTLSAFPTAASLAEQGTDILLRNLGFGYRAPFIHSTALLLLELAKAEQQTPDEYLAALAAENSSLEDARAKLLQFKGVGRKVADCIALFGLGFHQTVPVDVHVFQIAVRDYAFPASKATSMTPQLNDRVATHLSSIWGTHAGWAQQVLFYADLSASSLERGGSGATPIKREGASPAKSNKGKAKEEDGYEVVPLKSKWEQEVEELIATTDSGTRKRRRTTVITATTVVKTEDPRTPKKARRTTKSVKVEEVYPTPQSELQGDGIDEKTSPLARIARGIEG